MPKIRDLFTCENCGAHELEEVMIGVILTSRIESADEDGDFEYGEVDHQEGEVVRYQCAKCGEEIATDENELKKLLGLPHEDEEDDGGMFSFSLDGNCPHCGKRLEKVTADGHEAAVNDDGRLVEAESPDTDLILNKLSPDIRCGYCNNQLSFEATEE